MQLGNCNFTNKPDSTTLGRGATNYDNTGLVGFTSTGYCKDLFASNLSLCFRL